MSAEANVAAIRSFHAAMEAGDREALDRLLEELAHPDCEWYPLVTEVEGGGYRGREGARTFFNDFLDAFTLSYEDFEIEARGDSVVLVRCRMKARGRESGVDVEQEMGIVYELQDGLWVRGRAYPSHAAALQEVANA